MVIVPIYAALLVFLFVFLSVRTLRLRRKFKIPAGDAGNIVLAKAIRAHGNFTEYVPISLLMLYFVESTGTRVWVVHALCLLLLAGRAVHAYGLSQEKENFNLRVAGMASTFTTLLLASACLLLPF